MLEQSLAYFITFRTYGTWLHGDDRGSMDRHHNAWDQPNLPPDPERRNIAASRLETTPITLTSAERNTLDDAVRSHCLHQGWQLWAVNVRTEHVHVVVSSSETPERVMNSLKSYATRALREVDPQGRTTPVWSRHGSTRYLWTDDDLASACVYVMEGQTDRREPTAG